MGTQSKQKQKLQPKPQPKSKPEQTSSPLASQSRPAAASSPGRSRGRRFSAEQRAHAVQLARSGMKRRDIAQLLGTTTESIRRWVGEAVAREAGATASACEPGDASPATAARAVTPVDPGPGGGEATSSAPRDPGSGLSSDEREAILTLKKQHPSYGPAQLRAQLKRFKGWRVSVKAIARVLTANGYELVWSKSRPQGAEPIRFEAPRPNALWQFDFASLALVGGEKLHVVVALDDYSRFAVGHAVADSPASAVAVQALREAMARHGKPEAVRTDRGGAFVAKSEPADFARVLEGELIDHIVGHSYHPQGGGKVESLIGTIRRELWDVEHMANRAKAEQRIAEFLDDYNHHRAHMGIGGLTPADRYHGRGDRVLATIDGISRRRQGAWARQLSDGHPIEEVLGRQAGAPLEVLRLVARDGVMELHFCGARVTLGAMTS